MKIVFVVFFLIWSTLVFKSFAQKTEVRDDFLNNISEAVYLHPQETYDNARQAILLLGIDTLNKAHNTLLIILGRCKMELIDTEGAIHYFQRALQNSIKDNDFENISSAHLHLSNAYLDMGESDMARRHASVGFSLAIQNKNRENSARGLYVFAKHYRLDGNYSQSIEMFEQSARLFLQVGDSIEAAYAYNGLAAAYSNMDNFEESIVFYKKALQIFINKKYYSAIGKVLTNTGLTYLHLDKYDDAFQYMKQGLVIRHKINDIHGLGYTYSFFSTLHHVLGEHEKGNRFFQISVKYSMQSENSVLLASVFYSQAEYLEWAQDTLEAIMCYQNSLEFSKDIQYREMIIVTLKSLVDLFAGIGDYEKAFLYLQDLSKYEDFQFDPFDDSNVISLSSLMQSSAAENLQSSRNLVVVMGVVLLVFLSGITIYQRHQIKELRKKYEKREEK
jgi:tetratricopeptide (TPR) repeat protein